MFCAALESVAARFSCSVSAATTVELWEKIATLRLRQRRSGASASSSIDAPPAEPVAPLCTLNWKS